jgi:hypothetical protein
MNNKSVSDGCEDDPAKEIACQPTSAVVLFADITVFLHC